MLAGDDITEKKPKASAKKVKELKKRIGKLRMIALLWNRSYYHTGIRMTRVSQYPRPEVRSVPAVEMRLEFGQLFC